MLQLTAILLPQNNLSQGKLCEYSLYRVVVLGLQVIHSVITRGKLSRGKLSRGKLSRGKLSLGKLSLGKLSRYPISSLRVTQSPSLRCDSSGVLRQRGGREGHYPDLSPFCPRPAGRPRVTVGIFWRENRIRGSSYRHSRQGLVCCNFRNS